MAARFSRRAIPSDPALELVTDYEDAPFHGFAKMTPAGPRWTGRVELIPSKLDEPLHWRKPRRVFVNSMSDLFHEALSDEAIDQVFAVMALADQHTFQVLTKRPARMLAYISSRPRDRIYPQMVVLASEQVPGGLTRQREDWPLSNVWLGVSVEDQATADERIPLLLQTPAAVRFCSYEPALGPVDFSPYWLGGACWACGAYKAQCECGETAKLRRLDWLIVGGESGPGARPFDIAWARSAIAQCREAGVPVFMKQVGARPVGIPWPMTGKGGDPIQWPLDIQVREFPK